MKIESKTLYGNIGYIIRFGKKKWLIRDYDWRHRQYLLMDEDGQFERVYDTWLIGCEIISDQWERMKNGKPIRFDAREDCPDEAGESK